MVVVVNYWCKTDIRIKSDRGGLVFLSVLIEDLSIHCSGVLIHIEGRNELSVDLRDVEIQKNPRERLIIIRLAHVELWISGEASCDILSISEALKHVNLQILQVFAMRLDVLHDFIHLKLVLIAFVDDLPESQ